MTDRMYADFAAMWSAIMTQLRSELDLTESTCFWFLPDARAARAQPPSASDLFITVAPDGGSFDASLYHGGGDAQLTVETGFVVSIHRVWHLDPGNQDDMFLLNDVGVANALMGVLQALTGFDPIITDHFAVRELIRPEGFTKPWRSEDEHVGGLDVHFTMSFDIDMNYDPLGGLDEMHPPPSTTTPAPTTTTTPAP